MTNSANKIKELRDKGYKVYVYHSRVLELEEDGNLLTATVELSSPDEVREAREQGWTLLPNAGKTLVDICDEDGNPLATGMAVCGKNDNFNKTIGRDIALGRALKELSATL